MTDLTKEDYNNVDKELKSIQEGLYVDHLQERGEQHQAELLEHGYLD